MIGAAERIEACVGLWRDGADASDCHVGREESVELVGEQRAVYRLRAVEMGGHHEGMDAGVGASCGCEADGGAEKGGKGVLRHLLDADAVGLDLPAVIARAVVGEKKEIPMHGSPRFELVGDVGHLFFMEYGRFSAASPANVVVQQEDDAS